MTARLAALLWLAGAVVYFVAEGLAASALPGYSYIADYVSTLGNPDVTPRASLMNTAFAVQGGCFVAAAVLVTRARKRPWLLAFACANGIGNGLIAVVHSGQGNAWHVVGAALALIGGNGAAIAGSGLLMSRPYRVASVVLGAAGLLCLAVVAAGAAQLGLWERGSVYPIFAWQILTAVLLLRHQAGSASSIS